MFSFLSCQNYDSDKYIKTENKAINDIILEITQFEEMKNLNEWKNKKLKLYIVSKLDTNTNEIIKPTGYDISSNGVEYTKERIEKNKKTFEENLADYKHESFLFSDLKKGKIKARTLNYNFTNEQLKIELIEKNDFDKDHSKENDFGYLNISRVIFNKWFTKGYLSFSFICLDGCGWGENIEIKKINGKWKLTKSFSGWVI